MKKSIYLLFFMVCAVLPGHTAVLHAVFVADRESNIGTSTEKTLMRWHGRLTGIASSLGMTFDDHIFIYKDFDPTLVKTFVKGLEPGVDDVVFFLFAGHGYRTATESSSWPILDFHPKRGLRAAEIVDLLCKKKARLNVIVFDCCNDHLASNLPTAQPCSGALLAAAKNIQAGYRRLFLESEGTVIIAAAGTGQVTYTNSTYGHFFSKWLIQSIDLGAAQNKDWMWVLDRTQRALEKQKPHYQMIKKGKE